MNNNHYLTLNRLALICCVLMFFVVGRFVLTEVVGGKREAEFLLIVPMFLFSLAGFVKNVKVLLNPYIFFIFFSMISLLLFDFDVLKIAITSFSFIAVITLLTANKNDLIFAAKTMVLLVAFFAFLAILHFIILLFNPGFSEYGQPLVILPGSIGVKEFHPYVLLGLVTGEEYSMFGFVITRIKSFTTEPSLMVLYFFFPMALSLFLKGKLWLYLSIPMGIACLLSMSGMIFLGFSFSFFVFILLSKFKFKIVQYIILLSVFGFIFNIVSGNVDGFTSGLDSLKEQSSVFEKTKSFKGRSENIVSAFNLSLVSPLGSPQDVNAPAPIFINAMLKSGWLGGIAIIIAIWHFFIKSNKYLVYQKNSFHARLAVSALFGGLFVSSTMSDYGMTNYSGIIILLLITRVLDVRNDNQIIKPKYFTNDIKYRTY